MESPDQVRSYLQSISQHKLLSPEEEVKYGRQSRRRATCLDVECRFDKAVLGDEYEAQYLACLADELGESELSMARVDKIIKIGTRARERLIQCNLKLVISVAKKYQNRGLDLNDLCQEGALGLARAADKFDERKGYRFTTYAYWWIRQGITRALSQQSRTIRLPVHVTEKLNKLKKASRKASQQEVSLSMTEIEKLLKVKPGGAAEFLGRTAKPWSLSYQMVGGRSGDRETELIEIIASDVVGPEESVFQHDLVAKVQGEIKRKLAGREQEIMFERLQGKSLEAIGKSLNISRERVRQLEKNAKYKLRGSWILRELAQSLAA